MHPTSGPKAKVVYLPLDERPCNYDFPWLLSRGSDLELVRPPMEWMGDKKKPGRIRELGDWLEREAADAEAAIVSIDTLLYGGIVPSRLHGLGEHEAAAPLERLRRIRQSNPTLKLYAFHLLMRCPRYSSSDEEPDYYGEWGRELFLLGYYGHRERLGEASAEELAELEAIRGRLPGDVRDDYLQRRAVNAAANRASLELAADGTLDFLALPQDDAAPYGWTALDQQAVRERIRELGAELRTLMYPGADEAGCTLLARLVNARHDAVPLVYPRYSSTRGPQITPLYEDRMLGESLKLHILAAGGLLAESAADGDLLLLVNSPGDRMGEANGQLSPDAGYDVQRSVTELAEYGHYALSRLRKPVAVADVAFANGGDLQLLRLLGRKGMLPRLAGIAGWNTSANSIGTVLAQLMLYGRFGCTGSHLDFLGLRIAEDYGYCSAVRRQLADGPIKELGMDYFAVDGQSGRAAGMVREELAGFLERELAGSGLSVKILDCRMPWRRMFEVGLSVTAGTDEGRSDADVTGAAGAVPAEGCGESELSAAGRSGMREPSMEKAASAADNNEARG
ncbi:MULTISPECIES: DUF4127 family protein [unclassified Paenibacillus]|uniref:DUF4127 family protein n=1 Tax=unclassified Paenibacillus TaxID=185978 RepID=UPI0009564ED8|nr:MULTISPECIES: DUF4127 family protein [unclassified Paenibacillus]ASS68383.1 DUF4127 family protein [Paenibacillus sp. RUD330]SIR31487.1 Protein of unknown function [Paenibacillus sp. RU4X]SIR42815.1 Protein of unknown function [Paenibacillus sp. RU4T]